MTSNRLIILRGNSGSGKSSVACAVREKMGYGTALIEQDYIRRTLLREKDRPNQPNIDLIKTNAQFALRHYDVILEGILCSDHYGEMLRDLIAGHDGPVYVYYFDISLEETLRRHITKPNAHEFGEKELREWYLPKDVLMHESEQIIPETSSFSSSVERILNDVNS